MEDDLLRHAATYPDERECSLYRIVGRDPHNRGKGDVLLYVGETAREPFTRWVEHIHEKPWAWRIRGIYADDRVFASKAAVLAAEKHAIRTERPIYNRKHNWGNPWRIDTRGQRRRTPQVHRATAARWRPPRAATSPRPRRSWRWLQSPAALVTYAWLVLAGAGWWAADHYLQVTVSEGAVTGAVGAGVLLAGAAGAGAKRKHRRWWWLLCAVLGGGWLLVMADPASTSIQ